MFIEIHQDHWIDLSAVSEIQSIGLYEILIDGKVHEYDTEEDRETMLKTIRAKITPVVGSLNDIHFGGTLNGTV